MGGWLPRPVVPDSNWGDLIYINRDLHSPIMLADNLEDCWVHVTGNELRFRIYDYRRYTQFISWIFLGASPYEIRQDPAAYYGKPFVEQVGSAAYATVLGPQTSTKLLSDYTSNRTHFRQCVVKADLSGEDWGMGAGSEDTIRKELMETYDNWIRAFAIATETGMVMTQYKTSAKAPLP